MIPRNGELIKPGSRTGVQNFSRPKAAGRFSILGFGFAKTDTGGLVNQDFPGEDFEIFSGSPLLRAWYGAC